MKLFYQIVIAAIYFFTFSSCSNRSSKTANQNVVLRDYFSDLFLQQDFGYTLISSRALAIDWRATPTPFKNEPQKIIFNSKNFLFKECKTDSPRYRLVFLVNKRKFIETFNKNRPFFIKVLGQEITAEHLLEEITLSEKHILYSLRFDYSLLGILLGYGQENALLWPRYMKLVASLKPLRRDFVHPTFMVPISQWHKTPQLNFTQTSPQPGFCSLDEEREWLKANFNSSSYPRTALSRMDLISPLGFRVRESNETTRLRKKYTKCKKLLTKMFSGHDVVQVVFEQLKAEQSVLKSEQE